MKKEQLNILEEKAERLRKSLELTEKKIQKVKNTTACDIFRLSVNKKGSYTPYIYLSVVDKNGHVIEYTTKPLGATKDIETAKYTMKVLRRLEDPEVFTVLLELMTIKGWKIHPITMRKPTPKSVDKNNGSGSVNSSLADVPPCSSAARPQGNNS